jgi:hypothetical protein
VLVCPRGRAQNAAVPAQITQAIDPNNLVVLRGNTYPLAQPRFDQGAVPDAQPLHRMLLLLQRSPQQEKSLRQFLDEQQSKSSANFHVWLTPEQFGAQYGPAPADIQTVSSWLVAQGFAINRVSAGRTVIEFDGTAGQVRNAFHTQIHRYVVNGQEHTANSSDPEIPAALTPVVAGIVSLHNFPAQSHLRNVGAFRRSRKAGTVEPLSTPLYDPPNYSGQYPIVPGDFAIIYNVTPLWNAGIDGTGQTIAIVGETDVNIADIQNFRALFGLSNNFTSDNVILDGIDPGITGDETEADLDIEWSGAVAKNATIEFVVSAATEVTGGTHLSALYIVDHNVAPVLSESYGNCEASLGATNNQYYNSLWEQAAAQGITVVISAGDGGSAGCDDFNTEETATLGLAVSGYASTPFDVAVGGTDFDQINKWTQYWSATNDPVTLASALGYIPEIPWNDSCAQLGLVGCGTSQPGGNLLNIVAGSGGVSSLYPKPSWQSGTGIPQDNKRDLPDLSLFASNGFTGTGYLICESDLDGASCQVSGGSFNFAQIGGTSASAPSFAGIMALVNQSQAKQNLSNRQGNANYVLYALAKKQANTAPALNCNASASPVSACTFNDVTGGNSFFTSSGIGNNSVPCTGATPNCSSKVASVTGILVTPASTTTQTPAWTTGTGYDLATGLGSVNAQNLATNWKSANSVATSTTLSLNGGAAVNITHGSPVSVSVTVTPKAALGDVSLVATYPPSPSSPNGSSLGMAQFTLTSGAASGSTPNLAGGTYSVTAHYEGDGTNGPSDSPGVAVTVAPEASKTILSVPTFDPNTGRETGNTPTTLVYASPYIVHADVTNSAGSLTQLCTSVNLLGCPTGTVVITDALNGAAAKPLDAGTFALNSAGYTEDQTVQLSGGTHVFAAQYSGDNSYNKSSTTYTLIVTPASTASLVSQTTSGPVVGQQFGLLGIVDTPAIGGAVPTGTVSFFDGSTALPGTVTLTGIAPGPGGSASLDASLTTAILTGGTHSLTISYSGDANYAPSTSPALNIVVLYPTTASISASPQNIVYGTAVTATVVINTNVKSPPMTGNIQFFASYDGQVNNSFTQTSGTDANGNVQLTATVTFNPATSETIFAVYFGDSNFTGVTSQATSIHVTTPDFTLSALPSFVLTAGQTGTGTLTINPTSNLSSTVMLTCGGGLPTGSTCTITPSTINLANSASGSAMFSLTTIGPSPASASMVVANRRSIFSWFDLARRNLPRGPAGAISAFVWWATSFAAGLAAICLLLIFPRRRRKRAIGTAFAAAWVFAAGFALGCGGGGGGGITPPQSGSATVVVSSPTPKLAAGVPASLTATVTSSRSPTGTITFYASGSPFTFPIPLVGGSAQTQVTWGFPGTTTITAQYSGDGNNLPATSAPFYQVSTGSTSITVSAQTGTNVHQDNVNVTIQ